MNNKYSVNYQNILIFVLVVISLLSNQYYANKGSFPIESFAHYDISQRILNGDVPFRDYWAVSGIFIDYIQSLFFIIFGNSFQIYVLHASLFNALATLIIFRFFKELSLGNSYSFFYSVCFSFLAYPNSGTLYVDHHASLICLISSVLFLMAIKTSNRKLFFVIPILIGVAFLTKPAPTVYFFIFYLIIFILYILTNKKYDLIKLLIKSSIIFLLIIFFFGFLNKISLIDFIKQYILFPTTIADNRFSEIEYSIKNLIFKFDFIYLFLLPIIFIFLKKIFDKKKFLFTENFFYFFLIFGLSISLMFHQINTKNQLFILFLIPILSSFLHFQIKQLKINYSKALISFICLICLILTTKYHLRFNEDRKFHELQNVNFSKALDASLIHKKLSGLDWITPINPTNPEFEVKQIKNSLESIKNSNLKNMVITNYSFFSSALNLNTNSPSRWFIPNGGAYPVDKNNKFFKEYKIFLLSIIERKKIESILIISPVNKTEITRYLNIDCLEEKKLDDITLQLKIKRDCNL